MLKLSWGKRIAVLYIGFVLLIVLMMTLSMRQKVELVSDDYYDKELVFQYKIDETNNANALSERITHSISCNSFLIQYPSQFKGHKIEGNVLFFRPSDSSKDFTKVIHVDDNLQQSFELNTFSKGMYKMQISWKVNDTPYFSEETIVIP